jgi:hypothetical protein
MIVHELLECYNVPREEHDEEDPRKLKVNETKGEHEVERIGLEYDEYTQQINMTKLNIGMT